MSHSFLLSVEHKEGGQDGLLHNVVGSAEYRHHYGTICFKILLNIKKDSPRIYDPLKLFHTCRIYEGVKATKRYFFIIS